MSFSSTPLGHDRRLDHQTFLKGGSFTHVPTQTTTSPPRRVASISSIPLSYAYGAPTVGDKSPSKSTSPRRASKSNEPQLSEEAAEGDDDGVLSRYALLKQRNQALANRPGSSLGPGLITTPPQPNGATLKDTSVNIASAFHQAASSFNNMSTNASYGGRAHLPRSTSVEYEKEAQSVSHRRLAVPPSRAGGRKPPSKAGSAARMSDVENDHSGESVDVGGRAKSPFDHLADFTKRAIAPATFLMRQRSQEPEGHIPSRQATDATLVVQDNNSGSYDYANEEAEYQEMQKPSSKRSAAALKRGRISTDNQAYRPSASDLEEYSESDDDGTRKGRKRKSKKKGEVGGPLTTLPTTTYDKRRKRKGRPGKGGEQDEAEDDGSTSEGHSAAEHRSERSTTPMQRHGSVPRGSVPHGRSSVPPPPVPYDDSGPTDTSYDVEQGLEPIAEVDESEDPESSHHFQSSRRSAPRTTLRTDRKPGFSIGAALGIGVNLIGRLLRAIVVFIFRCFAMITLIIGRILGTLFDILVRKPLSIFTPSSSRRRGSQSLPIGKLVALGIVLFLVWYISQRPSLLDLSAILSSKTVYQRPELPAGTVDELSARLFQLETALTNLQSERARERGLIDKDLQLKQKEFLARINQLEGRVDKELLRTQNSIEGSRVAASKGLEGLQKEIQSLQAQAEEAYKRPTTSGNDEDARAKLQALEERVGSVEGSVKEAIELGQTAVKVGSAAGAVAAPSWWNRLKSGSAITIKSTDGQDVTALIADLFDKTLAQRAKDDLARVDYALSSGGAKVVPSLTSPTYELRSSYFFGIISGSSVVARSPVSALHHELHLGYCWPFAGSKGQLGVVLAAPIYVTEITIDHVAREVAHDMRPAPRHMEVWGLVEGDDNLKKYREFQARTEQERKKAIEKGVPVPQEMPYPPTLPSRPTYMRIASFTYDIHASNNIQTFSVPKEVQDVGIDFGVVVLLVNSNWGHPDFTCLYRFRVHGQRLQALPEPDQ